MATKKITELPFINTLSGSSVFDNPTQNVVVPVVLKGTTNQITVENFSKFMSLYSATTGSAGNTFVGPQIINNSLTINGNEIVNGNVNITGRLTVNEVVAQYETASILFSTGSTKLGDQITDTHEFTGSTNITGSLNYNGVLLTNIDANTIHKLQQATQSLQVTTASLNEFSASTNAHIVGISDFTSSQLAVNLGNSIYTASVDSHIVGISTYTSSVRDTLARVHQATQSLQVATASLNQFTASQDSRNFVISQYTSSTDAHIVGISDFTSSQLAVNLTISSVTGSLIGITNGLMAFTAALDNTYATDAQLYQLYQATRSLELHSGSMIGVTNGLMAYTASNTTLNTGLRGEVDGIEAYTASLKGQAIVSSSTQVQNYDVFALNSNLYTSTGSLIGITNGLMAFTAALDSTYATDAQLYQLYQATRSIELTTGSLIGITNGLMAFTAGLDSTYATDAQLYQLYQATQSLELLSGSLIGITNGLMAFTAALDSTYATDAQLYQLYAETASMKAEIAGIEAYTASLKGAAIVSSSTQIQNYDVFALNSNLYNGTGSIKGEIAGIEAYTASLKGAIEVSGQNVNVLGMITAQQFNVTFVSSSVMYQSGSTKFGNSNDDKHEFTGSIALTGTQTIASTAGSGLRIYGAAGTHQWDTYLNGENLRISDNTAGDGALVVDTRASFGSHVTASGNLQLGGNLRINGGNSVRLYESTNTNYWDVYTYTDNALRVNYKGAGGDEIILYNDGGINFSGAVTSSKVSINSNVGNYKLNVNSGINTSQATVMSLQQATDGAIKDAAGFGLAINNGGEATNAADLLISTATGGSLTTKVNVGSSGDVTVSTGNLVIGTAGKGIDFGINTGGAGKTSQLLDDYEEGTLTGTITCGTSGTVTLDNGYNTLSYTKIGSVVHVFGLLSVNSVSSPVGYFTIPLPFACANLGDSAATSAATIIINGTNAANTSDFVGWADETQSNIVVRRGDATGVQNTSANELKALTDIYIQFTYRAN